MMKSNGLILLLKIWSNQTKINIDIDNIDFDQVEESIKIFDEPYECQQFLLSII